MGWRDAATVAPNCSVINKAVGGTITDYWIEHLPSILPDIMPDIVLYYCGSNDINNNASEEKITTNISDCLKFTHDILPNTSVAYFSIIKAPQKKDKIDLIDRLNATVKAGLADGDLYIETDDVFLHNEQPVAEFFIEDKLHLTDAAYVALSDYARPLIADWMTPKGV